MEFLSKLPVTLGNITVNALGTINIHPSGHTFRNIWPIGFSSSRVYADVLGAPGSSAIYDSSIKLGADASGNPCPVFVVTRRAGNLSVEGTTPAHPWAQVHAALKQAGRPAEPSNGYDPNVTPIGLDMFGLSIPSVMLAIEGLPNAHQCAKYFFLEQRTRGAQFPSEDAGQPTAVAAPPVPAATMQAATASQQAAATAQNPAANLPMMNQLAAVLNGTYGPQALLLANLMRQHLLSGAANPLQLLLQQTQMQQLQQQLLQQQMQPSQMQAQAGRGATAAGFPPGTVMGASTTGPKGARKPRKNAPATSVDSLAATTMGQVGVSAAAEKKQKKAAPKRPRVAGTAPVASAAAGHPYAMQQGALAGTAYAHVSMAQGMPYAMHAHAHATSGMTVGHATGRSPVSAAGYYMAPQSQPKQYSGPTPIVPKQSLVPLRPYSLGHLADKLANPDREPAPEDIPVPDAVLQLAEAETALWAALMRPIDDKTLPHADKPFPVTQLAGVATPTRAGGGSGRKRGAGMDVDNEPRTPSPPSSPSTGSASRTWSALPNEEISTFLESWEFLRSNAAPLGLLSLLEGDKALRAALDEACQPDTPGADAPSFFLTPELLAKALVWDGQPETDPEGLYNKVISSVHITLLDSILKALPLICNVCPSTVLQAGEAEANKAEPFGVASTISAAAPGQDMPTPAPPTFGTKTHPLSADTWEEIARQVLALAAQQESGREMQQRLGIAPEDLGDLLGDTRGGAGSASDSGAIGRKGGRYPKGGSAAPRGRPPASAAANQDLSEIFDATTPGGNMEEEEEETAPRARLDDLSWIHVHTGALLLRWFGLSTPALEALGHQPGIPTPFALPLPGANEKDVPASLLSSHGTGIADAVSCIFDLYEHARVIRQAEDPLDKAFLVPLESLEPAAQEKGLNLHKEGPTVRLREKNTEMTPFHPQIVPVKQATAEENNLGLLTDASTSTGAMNVDESSSSTTEPWVQALLEVSSSQCASLHGNDSEAPSALPIAPSATETALVEVRDVASLELGAPYNPSQSPEDVATAVYVRSRASQAIVPALKQTGLGAPLPLIAPPEARGLGANSEVEKMNLRRARAAELPVLPFRLLLRSLLGVTPRDGTLEHGYLYGCVAEATRSVETEYRRLRAALVQSRSLPGEDSDDESDTEGDEALRAEGLEALVLETEGKEDKEDREENEGKDSSDQKGSKELLYKGIPYSLLALKQLLDTLRSIIGIDTLADEDEDEEGKGEDEDASGAAGAAATASRGGARSAGGGRGRGRGRRTLTNRRAGDAERNRLRREALEKEPVVLPCGRLRESALFAWRRYEKMIFFIEQGEAPPLVLGPNGNVMTQEELEALKQLMATTPGALPASCLAAPALASINSSTISAASSAPSASSGVIVSVTTEEDAPVLSAELPVTDTPDIRFCHGGFTGKWLWTRKADAEIAPAVPESYASGKEAARSEAQALLLKRAELAKQLNSLWLCEFIRRVLGRTLPDAEMFWAPVDSERTGFESFSEYVPHPTDFRTMGQRLSASAFHKIQDIFRIEAKLADLDAHAFPSILELSPSSVSYIRLMLEEELQAKDAWRQACSLPPADALEAEALVAGKRACFIPDTMKEMLYAALQSVSPVTDEERVHADSYELAQDTQIFHILGDKKLLEHFSPSTLATFLPAPNCTAGTQALALAVACMSAGLQNPCAGILTTPWQVVIHRYDSYNTENFHEDMVLLAKNTLLFHGTEGVEPPKAITRLFSRYLALCRKFIPHLVPATGDFTTTVSSPAISPPPPFTITLSATDADTEFVGGLDLDFATVWSADPIKEAWERHLVEWYESLNEGDRRREDRRRKDRARFRKSRVAKERKKNKLKSMGFEGRWAAKYAAEAASKRKERLKEAMGVGSKSDSEESDPETDPHEDEGEVSEEDDGAPRYRGPDPRVNDYCTAMPATRTYLRWSSKRSYGRSRFLRRLAESCFAKMQVLNAIHTERLIQDRKRALYGRTLAFFEREIRERELALRQIMQLPEYSCNTEATFGLPAIQDADPNASNMAEADKHEDSMLRMPPLLANTFNNDRLHAVPGEPGSPMAQDPQAPSVDAVCKQCDLPLHALTATPSDSIPAPTSSTAAAAAGELEELRCSVCAAHFHWACAAADPGTNPLSWVCAGCAASPNAGNGAGGRGRGRGRGRGGRGGRGFMRGRSRHSYAQYRLTTHPLDSQYSSDRPEENQVVLRAVQYGLARAVPEEDERLLRVLDAADSDSGNAAPTSTSGESQDPKDTRDTKDVSGGASKELNDVKDAASSTDPTISAPVASPSGKTEFAPEASASTVPSTVPAEAKPADSKTSDAKTESTVPSDATPTVVTASAASATGSPPPPSATGISWEQALVQRVESAAAVEEPEYILTGVQSYPVLPFEEDAVDPALTLAVQGLVPVSVAKMRRKRSLATSQAEDMPLRGRAKVNYLSEQMRLQRSIKKLYDITRGTTYVLPQDPGALQRGFSEPIYEVIDYISDVESRALGSPATSASDPSTPIEQVAPTPVTEQSELPKTATDSASTIATPVGILGFHAALATLPKASPLEELDLTAPLGLGGSPVESTTCLALAPKHARPLWRLVGTLSRHSYFDLPPASRLRLLIELIQLATHNPGISSHLETVAETQRKIHLQRGALLQNKPPETCVSILARRGASQALLEHARAMEYLRIYSPSLGLNWLTTKPPKYIQEAAKHGISGPGTEVLKRMLQGYFHDKILAMRRQYLTGPGSPAPEQAQELRQALESLALLSTYRISYVRITSGLGIYLSALGVPQTTRIQLGLGTHTYSDPVLGPVPAASAPTDARMKGLTGTGPYGGAVGGGGAGGAGTGYPKTGGKRGAYEDYDYEDTTNLLARIHAPATSNTWSDDAYAARGGAAGAAGGSAAPVKRRKTVTSLTDEGGETVTMPAGPWPEMSVATARDLSLEALKLDSGDSTGDGNKAVAEDGAVAASPADSFVEVGASQTIASTQGTESMAPESVASGATEPTPTTAEAMEALEPLDEDMLSSTPAATDTGVEGQDEVPSTPFDAGDGESVSVDTSADGVPATPSKRAAAGKQTSIYRGVSISISKTGVASYHTRLQVEKSTRTVGTFASEKQASHAYDLVLWATKGVVAYRTLNHKQLWKKYDEIVQAYMKASRDGEIQINTQALSSTSSIPLAERRYGTRHTRGLEMQAEAQVAPTETEEETPKAAAASSAPATTAPESSTTVPVGDNNGSTAAEAVPPQNASEVPGTEAEAASAPAPEGGVQIAAPAMETTSATFSAAAVEEPKIGPVIGQTPVTEEGTQQPTSVDGAPSEVSDGKEASQVSADVSPPNTQPPGTTTAPADSVLDTTSQMDVDDAAPAPEPAASSVPDASAAMTTSSTPTNVNYDAAHLAYEELPPGHPEDPSAYPPDFYAPARDLRNPHIQYSAVTPEYLQLVYFDENSKEQQVGGSSLSKHKGETSLYLRSIFGLPGTTTDVPVLHGSDGGDWLALANTASAGKASPASQDIEDESQRAAAYPPPWNVLESGHLLLGVATCLSLYPSWFHQASLPLRVAPPENPTASQLLPPSYVLNTDRNATTPLVGHIDPRVWEYLYMTLPLSAARSMRDLQAWYVTLRNQDGEAFSAAVAQAARLEKARLHQSGADAGKTVLKNLLRSGDEPGSDESSDQEDATVSTSIAAPSATAGATPEAVVAGAAPAEGEEKKKIEASASKKKKPAHRIPTIADLTNLLMGSLPYVLPPKSYLVPTSKAPTAALTVPPRALPYYPPKEIPVVGDASQTPLVLELWRDGYKGRDVLTWEREILACELNMNSVGGRVISLGRDRHGRQYYLFGTLPTELWIQQSSPSRWYVVDTPEMLEKLLTWLNEMGVAERPLKESIMRRKPYLLAAMTVRARRLKRVEEQRTKRKQEKLQHIQAFLSASEEPSYLNAFLKDQMEEDKLPDVAKLSKEKLGETHWECSFCGLYEAKEINADGTGMVPISTLHCFLCHLSFPVLESEVMTSQLFQKHVRKCAATCNHSPLQKAIALVSSATSSLNAAQIAQKYVTPLGSLPSSTPTSPLNALLQQTATATGASFSDLVHAFDPRLLHAKRVFSTLVVSIDWAYLRNPKAFPPASRAHLLHAVRTAPSLAHLFLCMRTFEAALAADDIYARDLTRHTPTLKDLLNGGLSTLSEPTNSDLAGLSPAVSKSQASAAPQDPRVADKTWSWLSPYWASLPSTTALVACPTYSAFGWRIKMLTNELEQFFLGQKLPFPAPHYSSKS